MKEEILRLRKEGHSYNYICSKLQCSKSTIAYHCNDEYRESALKRNLENKRVSMKDPMWQRSYKWSRRSVNVKQIREFIEDKFKSKCYLSGREVNLDSASSFHFDHIVPKSKGGTNELDNLGGDLYHVAKGYVTSYSAHMNTEVDMAESKEIPYTNEAELFD